MGAVEVGKRLKALRLVKGLGTQGNFAQILHVPTNSYNSWERGANMLPVDIAIKICGLTGATLDYIYREDFASLPGNLVILLSESVASRKKA